MLILPGTALQSMHSKALMTLHNGHKCFWSSTKLLFPVKHTNRAMEKHAFDCIVESICGYWASLPMDSQDAIAKIYKEANDLLNEPMELNELKPRLIELVGELGSYHKFEDVHAYLEKELPVKYPGHPELKERYDDESPDNQRTYLRDEYVDLVTFSVMLKSLIPIWGTYIDTVNKTVGTAYKEMSALSLIKSSDYVAHRAWVRLNEYVVAFFVSDEVGIGAVLGSMSSDSITDYMLSLIVVKRLALAKLVPTNSSEEVINVVSGIYNFLKYKVENQETNFLDKRVKPKVGERMDDEDNTSKLELVKVKEQVDKGTLRRLHVFCERFNTPVFGLYQIMDSTAPISLVNQCYRHIKKQKDIFADSFRMKIVELVLSGDVVAKPSQEVLASWEMLDVTIPRGNGYVTRFFSPEELLYLEVETRMMVFATTQALLIHWGYFDLAAIISRPAQAPEGPTMVGVQTDPVSADLVNEALQLYPYLSMTPGLKKQFNTLHLNRNQSSTTEASYRKFLIANNPLLREVKTVTGLMNTMSWSADLPPYLEGKDNWRSRNDNVILPTSVQNQLVSLVLNVKLGK